MYLLGIETSCDETSVAISHKRNILSNVTISQIIHKKYGGVVPEIASREHLQLITDVAEEALLQASIDSNKLNAIAVTNGPGLKGALLVGLNFAKGLSISLEIPIIGVNHMEGHLFSSFIGSDKVRYPFLCLLVSGGHTQIWLVNSYKNYDLMSTTIDDAAGEAFDKGARILGLNYPGGPEIEKLTIGGDFKAFKFPIPKIKNSKYNFSFSGLKTSLYYLSKRLDEKNIKASRKDIAASYQEAIIDTLIQKVKYLTKQINVYSLVVAGGVASNKRFRSKLDDFNNQGLYQISFPELKYCTDNAAMICMAGYEKFINKNFSDLSLLANPNLSMNE